jgi:hypothetical protein
LRRTAEELATTITTSSCAGILQSASLPLTPPNLERRRRLQIPAPPPEAQGVGMFKLHRHRSSDRLGERYDFRFSNFRAVQVCPSPPLSLPSLRQNLCFML